MIKRCYLLSGVFFLLLGTAIWGQKQDTSAVVILLQDVSIKSPAPRIVHRGDTIVFEASAYKVSAGAVLKDIVRKLPGVFIDKNGNITYNGKTVKEIKINGKDFFRGNNQIALDNLPVDIVKEIKIYEDESNESKRTGIPETEKNHVVDVVLKNELENTFSMNGHTHLANHRHYDQNMFVQKKKKKWSVSVLNTMKNVPDRGNDFDSSSGLTANKDLGGMFSWSNKEEEDAGGLFRIHANFNANRYDNDLKALSNSETFLSSNTESSFSNTLTLSRDKQNSYVSSLYLYWQPSSKTMFSLSTDINTDRTYYKSEDRSALFNQNPYLLTNISPLDEAFHNPSESALRNNMVNTQKSMSLTRHRGTAYRVRLFASHQFDSLGTTFSANIDYNIAHNENMSFNQDNINYWQPGTGHLPSFYNQFITTPGRPHSINANINFAYHFRKESSVYMRYNTVQSLSNENRDFYGLHLYDNVTALNCPYIGWLPTSDSLALVRMAENSQNTRYYHLANNVQVGTHLQGKKWIFRPYVDFSFKHARLDFLRNTLSAKQRKDYFSIEPALYLQYNVSSQRHIRFNYYTHTTSPDLMNLLDVADESHPLYVTQGNSRLKDTWAHSANIWIENFNTRRYENIVIHPSFYQAFSAIAYKLNYDKQTGRHISQADNVNGNWDAALGIEYNRAFGKDNVFNISALSNNSYNNNVGFVSTVDTNTGMRKNTIRTICLDEMFSVSFCTDKMEISLGTQFIYNHSRCTQGLTGNMETTVSTLKTSFLHNLPLHITIDTYLGIRFRRGFTEPSMNTTEYIWNAKLTRGFFKNQNLVIGVRCDDILRQRRHVICTMGNYSRQETSSNHVGSYYMLLIQYKFMSR